MRPRLTILTALALTFAATVSACGPLPTPTPSPQTTTPRKAIPHPLAGMDNCLQCHRAGAVKPAPQATHRGYKVDQCRTCHKPR